AGHTTPDQAGKPGGRYSTECGDDILRLLDEIGRRLTLAEMPEELARRGVEWSASTVSHTAPAMRRLGLLDHAARADERGHGFGLPEWSGAGQKAERLSTGCAADILKVIEEAGRRLTLTQVLDEFARRGIEWSHTTVSHTAPAMRKMGQL